MSLKDDVNAALEDMGHKVKFPVRPLDADGQTRLAVPIPSALRALRDGQLLIDVRVSRKGDTFALFTPIAGIKPPATQAFFDALLRRQFVNGQSSGLTYAIGMADQGYDALVAQAHWILPGITPQEFYQFYQRFLSATFSVIDDVNQMTKTTPNVEAIHP